MLKFQKILLQKSSLSKGPKHNASRRCCFFAAHHIRNKRRIREKVSVFFLDRFRSRALAIKEVSVLHRCSQSCFAFGDLHRGVLHVLKKFCTLRQIKDSHS